MTHAVLKTIAAFLNAEGGDLLIGVADDKTVTGIEADRFDNDDRFLLHLSHVVTQGRGDRAGPVSTPASARPGQARVPGELPGGARAGVPQWKKVGGEPGRDFFVRTGAQTRSSLRGAPRSTSRPASRRPRWREKSTG